MGEGGRKEEREGEMQTDREETCANKNVPKKGQTDERRHTLRKDKSDCLGSYGEPTTF